MTPEIIIGIGLLLMIVGYAIYKKSSSKFHWTKNAENHYTMVCKGYDATIYIDDEGKVNLRTYRLGHPLFNVNNCPSVKWAKDKAEQVILEDEKKLAK